MNLFKKDKGGAATASAKRKKGRALVEASPYHPLLPAPADDPVAMRGASQERGRADIHYLWGPGRLLGQRLQAWSAILLFGSIAFVGVGASVIDTTGTRAASASSYVDAEQQVRRPVRRAEAQDGLIVNGRPYYPALEQLPEGYSPPGADRLSSALRGAAEGATDTSVWDQLGGREVDIEEFWSTKIPRKGLLARTSYDGFEYAFLGTYVADTLPQIGGGGRRAWPAVFVHRVDPAAEGGQRSILYQLEAPLLAERVTGVRLISPEMAPEFWAVRGPQQEE